ncbi:hypothetical protein [Egicoccus sp. AB-alg2]|uniref:hypothetical protein n=1 Tax=Egicoccus sp. AB-alg2 TaxID=3242693 RepID=UPI00359EE10C
MPRPRIAVRPEQVRAAVLLGAPLLLALTLWVVALVTDTGPFDAGTVASRPDAVESGTGAGGDDDADDDADAPADGRAEDDQAEESAESEEGRDDAGDEPEVVTVEFDDVCAVELDPSEHDDPRPWDFEDCERAPITLGDGERQWVVVVASLWGDDFTEREALARLDERGRGRLLWSSHYPSLNPGLWVVVEGPFPDEEAAERAAERIGNGAYARELSDDEGDRYCIATDGCVGETR